MQHSLVFIFSRTLMMFSLGTIFMLIFLDMSLGVSYNSTNVTLSLYKEEVITSPGYPHRDYERDTNYTWDVIADAATEEISINITIDINRTRGYTCDDYLLIQEINPSTKNFTVFKQCGQLTTYRIVRGNRLLVTLVSNHDKLTSRGFQIIINVFKVGTTRTTSTPSTTTIPTDARTTASTLKTTAVPLTTIRTAKVQTSSTTTTSTTTTSTTTPSTTTTSTTTPSTTTPSTTTTSTTTPSTTTPSTTTTSTTTLSTTTLSTTTTSTTTTLTTTSTPKLTTQAMSLTTPPTTKTTMTPNTNATTLIKSKSPLTSTATTSALITSDGNATASTKKITTLLSSSFQSMETSYQTTTETQTKQSSTSETIYITTSVDTVTDKDSSFWNMFGTLEKKTVILLIGLGVLEVTLIVVGVLAVKRYRRKKKSNPSRQARKRNDDRNNSFTRQNSCGETNVYDEIDIDEIKEEEENQYKELPEGVYDTTLKRRSHLKSVGERKSNYSRRSIINMFRTSSYFRRKGNETSVMTFSSFKGPIQSQIGEKN